MRFNYSSEEISDLLRAWIAISVAFAIVMTGIRFDIQLLMSLIISLITVGTGFLLHELAHKFLAQKYGCWAEFRADDKMLMLAIAMSFFGFVFAAPGAVMIQGNVSLSKNGKISLAGPLTNLVLGILFGGIALAASGLIKTVALYGMNINFWLGLFNMIPFPGLDGSKVLVWNKLIYGIVLALSIVLVFGSRVIV